MSLEHSFSTDGEEFSEAIVNFDGENGNQDNDPSVKFPIKQLNTMFDSCAPVEKPEDEQMRVFLRVRPFTGKQTDSTITVESDTSIVTNAPENSKRAQYTKMEERHYSFTKVFGKESTQAEVFTHSVEPLMNRFINGDSVVFFAYGMTNAGKTHTIQGTPDKPGMLPMLVETVLSKLESMSEWDLQTSMMEIYQDKIYDLLGKKKDKLSIRDGNGRVEVMKLTSHPISSAADAMDLMNTAAVKRSKSNTFLNTGSSRSHAIYSLTLNRVIDGREVSAVFQCVDLAGAERGKRTMGTMTQQREANNINMSLMQLWRCLQAMQVANANKTGKGADVQIPFRESKLTHLLMPLLARVGLKGIAMITCVNPQIDDYDETISILGNASLACQIKEISDIGRATTVGIVGQVTAPSNPADNIRAHRRIKRESDDLNSKAASAVRNAVGKHRNSSNESATQKPGAKKQVRIKKEKKDSTETAGSEEEDTQQDDGDDTDFISESALGSELKKLREEVRMLESENNVLVNEQIERETAIREEVAEEMADASAVLLDQIRELQEQVDETSSHFHFDVTKSVKKAKKRHIDQITEENSADLEDALRDMELELDQVKEEYESQIDMLTEEKDRLMTQLEQYRNRAEKAESRVEALVEELEEEKKRVKAPEADEMPDISIKIHEGTQTDMPPPSPVDEMAFVPHLTQTSDYYSQGSQEEVEVAKQEDVISGTASQGTGMEVEEEPAATIFTASESTAATAAEAEATDTFDAESSSNRSSLRNSIRSRSSSAASILSGSELIITAPSIVNSSEEDRKSAAAEFENRLKRDQRFSHKNVPVANPMLPAPVAKEQQEEEEEVEEEQKPVEKQQQKSPARSPLGPADSAINANANAAGGTATAAGGRTRTVYGRDGRLTHVPMKEAPKVAEKQEEAAAAPSKKRLLSPMRSGLRPPNNENAPKVFHTAKSRARAAAVKLSPKKAIKEEPLYGAGHPISKRLRNTRA